MLYISQEFSVYLQEKSCSYFLGINNRPLKQLPLGEEK